MGCCTTAVLVPETQQFIISVCNQTDGAPTYRYQSGCAMRNVWLDCLENCQFGKRQIEKLESGDPDKVKKTKTKIGEGMWHFYHQFNTNRWHPLSPYNVLR